MAGQQGGRGGRCGRGDRVAGVSGVAEVAGQQDKQAVLGWLPAACVLNMLVQADPLLHNLESHRGDICASPVLLASKIHVSLGSSDKQSLHSPPHGIGRFRSPFSIAEKASPAPRLLFPTEFIRAWSLFHASCQALLPWGGHFSAGTCSIPRDVGSPCAGPELPAESGQRCCHPSQPRSPHRWCLL